ncbi:hypothetical protein L1987_45003 [Smallanthus sonchifolius]|uniref:Uncharacterized protein n=1 Tax=Smallanthus sonchifolius TaxID=185202 RepID=A0ACB9GT60_9ASTR|nr:hypothetical protein L1987_45003 [Smallanthus sonchifolius]
MGSYHLFADESRFGRRKVTNETVGGVHRELKGGYAKEKIMEQESVAEGKSKSFVDVVAMRKQEKGNCQFVLNERIVWIEISGLPWTERSYGKIVAKWGGFLFADEDKDESMETGRVEVKELLPWSLSFSETSNLDEERGYEENELVGLEGEEKVLAFEENVEDVIGEEYVGDEPW